MDTRVKGPALVMHEEISLLDKLNKQVELLRTDLLAMHKYYTAANTELKRRVCMLEAQLDLLKMNTQKVYSLNDDLGDLNNPKA